MVVTSFQLSRDRRLGGESESTHIHTEEMQPDWLSRKSR